MEEESEPAQNNAETTFDSEVMLDELELPPEPEVNFESEVSLDVLDKEADVQSETEIFARTEEIPAPEISLDALDIEPDKLFEPDIAIEESNPALESDIDIPELSLETLDLEADIPELSLEEDLNIDIPDILDEPELPIDKPETTDELKLEQMNELESEESKLGTENEELNLEELELDSLDLEESKPEESDSGDDDSDMDLNLDIDIDDVALEGSADSDDDLDDVLSMLDTDSDLAEINDMLKKSDNNEPIQDDMMDLLNQMAENEEAFVDADEEKAIASTQVEKKAEKAESASNADNKKAKKEKSKKKKGKDVDFASEEDESEKKPGFFGKLFNALTEELVPEPTEEELAAEKAAKEAKKQENQTKKEEEKAAKEQEKEAKAADKEAAQKAKAEAAAQKKKEKAAAKEAKLAAKRAKEAAEGPKKRIPPKKIAIAAVFGASVCGAVIVATNVLASQGYIQKARNAFDSQDYKTVYLSTYGMDLNGADEQMQKKSEVILKMQRRYDSYQTNLKMDREIEALNSLIMVYTTYDAINADAEQYGAMQEVDAIKADIENILSTKYGLDEASARELLLYEDNLEYTMALNKIILGTE